jgi:RNA polymerase sigma factor (sigma-70 family)
MEQSNPQSGDQYGDLWRRLRERLANGEDPHAVQNDFARAMQIPLYQHVGRKVGDRGAAEDIVQIVLIKAITAFADLIKHPKPTAWIYRVANNEVANHYRALQRRGGEVLSEPSDLEAAAADQSALGPFEEDVETRIGSFLPMAAYLETLVAMGALREAHRYTYWYGVAMGVNQQEIGDQLGVGQSQVAHLKREAGERCRQAMYLCEILGLVRPPHRGAQIRAHLDLADAATELTEGHRHLLRTAGVAVRRDHEDRPVLHPKDAQAAIRADSNATLDDLHEAETRYAAAIPNPTPHCIQTPCAVHTPTRR